VTEPESETLDPPPSLLLTATYLKYTEGPAYTLFREEPVPNALPYKTSFNGFDPDFATFNAIVWKAKLSYPEGISATLKFAPQKAVNSCSEISWNFVLEGS